MSEHESLTSIVECAIALAGFSGIVVALGRQPGAWVPADRFRLLNVLIYSLTPLFLAYLPMVLTHAGLGGSLLWRVSSGAYLFVIVTVSASVMVRMRRLSDDVRMLFNPIVYWVSIIALVVTILAQLLNVLGLGFQPQFGAYFLGLVLSLLVGAIQFARILFARPK